MRKPINKKTPKYSDNDIAIIGMSGRFPGAANIRQFFENLKNGEESITFLSDEELRRAGIEEYLIQDPNYIKTAFVLENIDRFDASFFNIPPSDAETLDPQQRLSLECAWSAFEDAGYTAGSSEAAVGMFCGSGGSVSSYLLECIKCDAGLQGETASLPHLGNDKDFVSTKISYKLNITGPSINVQTACSTSLVAVHMACQSIINNECDMALAGGVNIRIPHRIGYILKKGSIFSHDGHVRAFDANAQGIVFGSGLGLILLKPVKRAINDRDHIYAVIKGSAINNDGGEKMSYMATTAKGQVRCMEKAFQAAKILPETISYIEAHGTGTSMGDHVEITALTRLFDTKISGKKQYCAVGSVKSNIGHSEIAAGIAGLIKTVLCLKHRTLVPSINYSIPNPNINFKETAFYVNDKLDSWKSKGPRRACVNSLGIGGTNAFIILEEAPDYQLHNKAEKFSHYLIPIAGKKENDLYQKIKDISDWLNTTNILPSIRDIAHTLQIGRKHFNYRFACIAGDSLDLRNKIQRYLEGKSRNDAINCNRLITEITEKNQKKYEGIIDNLFSGYPQNKKQFKKKLAHLANAYVRGYALNWERFANQEKAYKVSLPSYPFSGEPFWVKPKENSIICPNTNSKEYLHPLLHENTSDLSQQKFSSTFTGSEFFLKDHRIFEKKVLPSAVYLEMAIAAFKRSLEKNIRNNVLADHAIFLKNIIWAKPIVVNGKLDIHIRLVREDSEDISYEIYTEDPDSENETMLHSQGIIGLSPEISPQKIKIKELQCNNKRKLINSHKFYAEFRKVGLHHGPAHQGIKELFLGEGIEGLPEVLAELYLPSAVSGTLNQFTIHPSILDSALQSSIGIYLEKGCLSQLQLPFALDHCEILGDCRKIKWSWVRLSGRERDYADKDNNLTVGKKRIGKNHLPAIQKIDIDLCDDEGNLCAKIKGFSYRALIGNLLYENEAIGRVLINPTWNLKPLKDKSDKAGKGPFNFQKHHIIVCGIGLKSKELKSKIPEGSRLKEAVFTDIEAKQTNLEHRFEEYSLGLFRQIQKIMNEKPMKDTLIQVLTPSQGEEQTLSGLSGLLKTVQLENAKIQGQIIAADKNGTPENLIINLEDNTGFPEDQQIRYDGKKRYVFSLEELPEKEQEDKNNQNALWKEGGVYLITGGLGGIGRILAETISSEVKSASVILAGRSELTDKIKEKLKKLKKESKKIEYKSVDISDTTAVEALIRNIKNDYGGLNGIMHCAGLIQDNYIIKKTENEFSRVLAPKVKGTINLDRATLEMDLDFFVMFSSRSGLMGNIGQSDYAAANAFMDAFALYRHSTRKKTSGKFISINWPLWKDGGMSIAKSLEDMNYKISGERPMPTEIGVKTLKFVLSQDSAQVSILYGKRDIIRRNIFKAPCILGNDSQKNADTVKIQTTGATVNEFIIKYLKTLLSKTIKLSEDKIRTDVNFQKYGFDSIVQLPFLNKLETITGSLPKTLLYEYVSINELAKYLLGNHGDAFKNEMSELDRKEPYQDLRIPGANRPACTEWPINMFSRKERIKKTADDNIESQTDANKRIYRKNNDIAVIGLAGRYPESPDIDIFWRNLEAGKNCITRAAKGRFKGLGQLFQYDRPIYGGFIAGINDFDHKRFEINEEESERMTPEQKLFLETAGDAFQDSGYDKARIVAYQQKQKIGVYVGTMYNQSQYSKDRIEDAMVSSNSSDWEIANRISHYFNLLGPSIALSTACSSSITAIYLAMQGLQNEEIGMALAGGINLTLNASKYRSLEMAGYLEKGNKSKPFGNGNGYIPGEGVGAAILKPLEKAIDDGDKIWGVIKSCCINHTGGRQKYTVPDPVIQGDLIKETLRKSGVEMESIQYIEAASNGSPLGDPIEIVAMSRAFNGGTRDRKLRSIGTVKSNIGHLEAASGISQLTKVLLQMKHKRLVASINSEPLNKNINLEDSFLRIQKTKEEWKPNIVKGDNGETRVFPKRVLLNSFGAGGACASMVIEEYEHQSNEIIGARKDISENTNDIDNSRIKKVETLALRPFQENYYKDLFQKLRDRNVKTDELVEILSKKYYENSEIE